jgi:hypothetical protein
MINYKFPKQHQQQQPREGRAGRIEIRILSREINFDTIGKFVDGVLVSTRKVRTFGF